MLFTARCFREHLRFRDADGIASTLAGGDFVAELVGCGCLRGVVALTYSAKFKDRFASMRQFGK